MKLPNRNTGFSLVEIAIALSVLGLLLLGVLAYLVAAENNRLAGAERDLMIRAESALMGFVYENHRLPRPAASPAGEEVGAGSDRQKGYFPWRTVGLPDSAASRLAYGVYRDPAPDVARNDRDLAAARARFEPLAVEGLSDLGSRPSGGTLLDLCFAVDQSNLLWGADTDPGYLHTDDGDGNLQQIAYALASPGLARGEGFELDPSAPPSFDPPSSPTRFGQHQRVAAASFSALFGHLNCAEGLAAIGHTHFNVAASMRLMERAMLDYAQIMELNVLGAAAGLSSAIGGLVSASAGIISATANLASAITTAIQTVGGASGLIAIAVADIVANSIAAATAAAGLGLAIANQIHTEQLEQFVSGVLVPEAQILGDSIEAAAEAGDRRGF